MHLMLPRTRGQSEYAESDLKLLLHGADQKDVEKQKRSETWISMQAEVTASYSLELMAELAEQILSGLVYIHGEDQPHLDIKPENILLA